MHKIILASIAASLLAVACTSGENNGKVTGNPVPVNSFGAAYANAVCDAIVPCCQENGFENDVAKCKSTAAETQAKLDEYLAKTPSLHYDAQKAGNCLAQYHSIAAACGKSEASVEDTVDCNTFLYGDVQLGGQCDDSVVCAPVAGGQTSCYSTTNDGASDAGVCVTYIVGDVGSNCGQPENNTVASCDAKDDSLFCDYETKKCAKRVAVGDTCSTSNGNSCVEGSYCDYNAKVCKKSNVVSGEADCTAIGNACDENSACDYKERKCVAKKAVGAACEPDNDYALCEYGCDSTANKCRANKISAKQCKEGVGLD